MDTPATTQSPRRAHRAAATAARRRERFVRETRRKYNRIADELIREARADQNPNRGKRHAARMVDAAADARIRDARRDYRPLVVSHPTVDAIGRRNPRTRTSYTV